MQRPPNRKSPPILFSRGGSDWIRRVTQRRHELSALHLTAAQREKLDQWAEAEFIYSTFRLEDADLTREQAAQLVTRDLGAPHVAEDNNAPRALLVSLRKAVSVAREQGKSAELTRELLLKLNSSAEAGFRRSEGDPSRSTKPVPPEHLEALVDGACQWYTAESFTELNPIEQASIVFLRLIDLQPFELGNERTALVAASLFTVRSGLPPIVIKPEMRDAYRRALDEGSRMNTQPMVELMAGAVEQCISEMIKQAGMRK